MAQGVPKMKYISEGTKLQHCLPLLGTDSLVNDKLHNRPESPPRLEHLELSADSRRCRCRINIFSDRL